jgi:glycosyltransferase involved in cell wall biosynthesis
MRWAKLACLLPFTGYKKSSGGAKFEMNVPAISIVIPTRNRVQYILEALDSVFAQTFKDYEVIVIDDGSTDGTREALGKLVKSESIRYEWHEARGVSAARNLGIHLALAPYIAFLDSDDLFLPTKLEKQIRVFWQNPDLGFVHCNFSKFDEQGRNLGVRDTSRFRGHIYPGMLLEWSVLMAMPCMLMAAHALKEVGGFDEQMTWAEDLDIWRRIARRYPIEVVPETLVKVRVHSTSTSFDKIGGRQGFTRYLEKALVEDPGLSRFFRQKAAAKMYAKLAQNLLGEGHFEQMKQARQLSLRALRAWPWQFSALFTWLISFLPRNFRLGLASWLRRVRYPKASD